MMKHFKHTPVMIAEVIKQLNLKPGSLIVDATLGGGGHARAILANNKAIKVIGVDQDIEAIEAAKENLKGFSNRTTYIQGNFVDIKANVGHQKIGGILFDLGVSSYQIDSAERGFSFQADAPLDMRMDTSSNVTAADIINNSCKEELERIIGDYGEERFFRRITSAILRRRPISKTSELADIVKYSIPKSSPINTTKSIARVFQAFRIAVNKELASLEKALSDSIDLLAPHGRIVVISYHSLEDRIVKNIFKRESVDCICPPKQPICTCSHRKKLHIITKKPVTPGPEELKDNPRARSAKLRAAEQIGTCD